MIFADLALARRLERTEATAGARFVEAHRQLSPESHAEWIEVAGCYAMFDGPDSPVTQTFGLGLFAEPTVEELNRIEAFFKDRGAPIVHEVSPLAGIPLADLLICRGYRPVEFTSVLYQPLLRYGEDQRSTNARLRTRLINADEHELWSQISVRGWSIDSEWTQRMLNFGRAVSMSEGSLAFFAELDGEPVATGVLRCDAGVALFAGASTVPEARKHGAQRALLEARMSTARDHHCELAMMCTAPGSTSQHNAEREGFRIAYTRVKWQRD